MQRLYDEAGVRRGVESLAEKIAAAFRPEDPLNIIGILTRGEILAQRIARLLEARGYGRLGRGVLDITLYRDDLPRNGPGRQVMPTELNVDLDDKPLVLVDDVLFTGRSTRSALNALIDFGRPSVIRLAVLADRGGRELPIAADFVAYTLRDVPPSSRVSVHFVETDGADEIVIEPK